MAHRHRFIDRRQLTPALIQKRPHSLKSNVNVALFSHRSNPSLLQTPIVLK